MTPKNSAQQTRTLVKDLKVEVGESGTLKLVAELQPVKITGTTVARAQVLESEQIAELDLHVGDTVIVRKAGKQSEVVRVVKELRPADAPPYPMPTHCPKCKLPVVRLKNEGATRCLNATCRATRRGMLRHWVRVTLENNVMDSTVIEQLVKKKLLKSVADLYNLTVEQLSSVKEMNPELAQKIVDAIAASKDLPWAQVLYGLKIPYVTVKDAQRLSENFATVDQLVRAERGAIAKIDNISSETADAVYQWFCTRANQTLIQNLQAAGLQIPTSIPNLADKEANNPQQESQLSDPQEQQNQPETDNSQQEVEIGVATV